MAEDKVTPGGREVKQYLVGQLKQLFSYCVNMNDVRLHEVILSSAPSPLYFDIEIKKVETHGFGFPVYRKILRDMERRWCEEYEEEGLRWWSFEDEPLTASDVVDDISVRDCLSLSSCSIGSLEAPRIPARPDVERDGMWADFCSGLFELYKSNLTEQECRAGIEYLVEFIQQFVWHSLSVPSLDLPESIDVKVLTGCRSDKFSVHIFLPGLWFDSNVVSMPLFVYELARAFQKDNFVRLVTLLRCRDLFGDSSQNDMISFHLRALMLHNMTKNTDLNDPSTITFRGIDDTLFDEAVYSVNRNLRCAGASKPGVGALQPYLCHDAPVFCSQSFGALFSPLHLEFSSVDEALFRWSQCLMTACPGGGVGFVLVKGLHPTSSYPRPKWWEKNKDQLRADDYDSDLRDICFVGVATFANFRDGFVRYEEWRPTVRVSARQGGPPTLSRMDVTIKLDDEFVGEDGVARPFWKFQKNEFLCCLHGEETASGSVFAQGVGYHCFGCNTTFYVDVTCLHADMYEFTNEEIVDLDILGVQYMPNIDWATLLDGGTYKFVLLSSPMGSGKTFQLQRFVEESRSRGVSVLVVTHRQMLATQIANLFGMPCYDTLDGPIDNYECVVCCLNSIFKITEDKTYDVVIFDEMALIRRSFLASTMKKVLNRVLQNMRWLVACAKLVVLAQDEFSRDDVGFYTIPKSVDPEDRNYIYARQFTKQVVHHPVEYTEKIEDAISNLINAYRRGMDGGVVMTAPFVIYCSAVKTAEYIVTILRYLAPNDEARNHIKGVWRSLKLSGDGFSERFSAEPNLYAHEADVLVCTSIIGAGFSINTHFLAFHAFFTVNVLCHMEERQFLFRVRYILDVVVPQSRQSYVYCQPGPLCGKPGGFINKEGLRGSIEELMKEVQARAGVTKRRDVLLTNTELDVKAEILLSKLKHSDMMFTFLSSFASSVARSQPRTAEEQEEVKSAQSLVNKGRKRACSSIVGFLLNKKPITADTLLEDHNRYEYEDEMFTMYRFLCHNAENSVKQIVDYAVDDFHVKLFYQILHSQGIRLCEKMLVTEHFKTIKNVAGAVLWLFYLYPSAMDFTHEFYKEVVEGKRQVDTAAKCWLLKHVITPLLMGDVDLSPANSTFLITKAKDPFLVGAEIKAVTKQANGAHNRTQTPLITAVREMASRNQAIRHAINIARGRHVHTMEELTECQFLHVLKTSLQYAGCELKKLEKKKHHYIVKGKHYLLALAMCTKAFRRNLISIYDGITHRSTFNLQPPPVTFLLMQALELYEDCVVQLSTEENLTWEMPRELREMKSKLDRWHDGMNDISVALSREDICWDATDFDSVIDASGMTVTSLLRRVTELQAMDRAAEQERFMRRVTNIVVAEEASLDMGTEIRLPPCPFIDSKARERDDTSAEDEEGFSYISDMTEATY